MSSPPVFLAAILASAAPLLAAPTAKGAVDASLSTNAVLSDMSRLNEAPPEGVPASWDWAKGPIVQHRDAAGYGSFVPWGQAYQCAGVTPKSPTPPVVEMRNLRGFVLSRSTGRWRQVTGTNLIQGAAYNEDFSNNASVPATYTSTPASTKFSLTPGHNFHFWNNQSRASIDGNDVAGVTVTIQARLDPLSPLNWMASFPCLLISVGADYWRSASSAWDGFQSTTGVAIGRFKRIGMGWRRFSMTTVTDPATLAGFWDAFTPLST